MLSHFFSRTGFHLTIYIVLFWVSMVTVSFGQVSPESSGGATADGITVTAVDVTKKSEDRLDADMRAAQLYEQALVAMDRDQEDLAFELVRKAKKLAPDNSKVSFLMALVLADRHRYPEAIRLLEKLSETDSSIKLPAMGQTADWLIKSGKWLAGEKRYQELLRLAPDASLVHRGLASLYLRQGLGVKAAEHLQKLCELGDIQEYELRGLLMSRFPFPGDAKPDNFDPIGDLGLAKAQAAYRDWQSVGETLRDQPLSSPEEIGLLGRSEVEQQNWEGLKTWIEKYESQVTSASVISSDALYALAVHDERTKKFGQAAQRLMQALKLDATDVAAYQALSRVTSELGFPKITVDLQKRTAMIVRTQELGEEMAGTQDRSYEKMSELIRLLVELRRPLEALAWRSVRLAYGHQHGTVSDAQSQSLLDAIIRERELEIQRVSDSSYADFVVCGLAEAMMRRSEDQ